MKAQRQILLFLLACGAALAHPMGNFSVSHYAKFETGPRVITLTYALDLAEIPSFELLRHWNLERNSPAPALQAKALEQARQWVDNLAIAIDAEPLRPVVRSAHFALADGAGGLSVIRITALASLPRRSGTLTYEDRNYPDRAGWKEIVRDNVPDSSRALTAYPEDPRIAPPQDLRAEFRIHALPAAPATPAVKPLILRVAQNPETAQPAAARVPPPSVQPGSVQKGDYLSEMLRRGETSLPVILIGLAVAFGFGAMHALSPGHGKTIVAAYLVGSRGTFKHALLLGGMVTFTHTLSVFLLGLGTLFLSRYIVPDKIYPVLSTVSGLMIVFVGGSLFYQRLSRLLETSPHSHDHPHDHSHDHPHHHGPGGHTHTVDGEVTTGSLISLAVSGGLVPCPSALVLLLSAIAIGKVGLGLLLLTSFSLGLSLILIAIGCLVLYAKHLLPDHGNAASHPIFRMVPVISAALITCVGLFMTAAALGFVKPVWN